MERRRREGLNTRAAAIVTVGVDVLLQAVAIQA
jgi:hypothetical protein